MKLHLNIFFAHIRTLYPAARLSSQQRNISAVLASDKHEK